MVNCKSKLQVNQNLKLIRLFNGGKVAERRQYSAAAIFYSMLNVLIAPDSKFIVSAKSLPSLLSRFFSISNPPDV